MLEADVDNLNNDLDTLSDQTFDSIPDAWHAVALKLETHGVTAPVIDNFDDELCFKILFDGIEEPPYYLHVIFDTDLDEEVSAKYNVYATLTTPEELDILDSLGGDEEQIWQGQHHLRTRKAEIE